MITSKIMTMTMGCADISRNSLFHEISKYIDIFEADVDEIIRVGTKGYLERYERVVAWILGLKRFIPEGWKPTLRTVVYKPVQSSFAEVKNKDNGRGRDWSSEEFGIATRMKEDGSTCEHIGYALDRTEQAIRTKFSTEKKDK